MDVDEPVVAAAAGAGAGAAAGAGRADIWALPVVVSNGTVVGHALLRRVQPDGTRVWDVVRGTDGPPPAPGAGDAPRRANRLACAAVGAALLHVAAPRVDDVAASTTLHSLGARVYGVRVSLEDLERWSAAVHTLAPRFGPPTASGHCPVPAAVLGFDDVRIVATHPARRRGGTDEAAAAESAAEGAVERRRGGIPFRGTLPTSSTPAAKAAVAWAETPILKQR
jgi:hypothetical protein